MKTFLVGIVCLFLGAAAFYGYTQYTKVADENKKLAEKLKMTNSPSTMPTQYDVSSVSGTPSTTEEKGSISGKLGFPSEGIPPLLVYAIDINDDSNFFMVETGQNQGTFMIEGITPGTYGVVAYDKANPSYSGGYSQAVPCGLSVSCTDHSLIPVVVIAGQQTTGAEVRDWYAPEGTFPAIPN